MAKNVMEMKRGTYKTKNVWVPAAMYTPGGKLLFAAKPGIDDDITDTNAVVKISMSDADIIGSNDAGDQKFLLVIPESATRSIDCGDSTDYVANLKYIDASGRPSEPISNFTFRLFGSVNNRDS